MHKLYFILQQEAIDGDQGTGDSFVQSSATPEEIALRLSSPVGTVFEDITKEDDKEDLKDIKGDDKSTETHVESPIWDILKSDEGFVMPDEITSENEQELLKTFIAKKFGFDKQQELHPLAKQIQEMSASNPNLTINDLVNTVSEQYVDAKKMTADQKISFDLYARYGVYDAEKNPDGLTDDDVAEHIAKLTKVEKQEAAKIIEQNIENYNKKLTDEYKEKQQQQFLAQYDDIVKQTKEAVSKLKIELSKVESIYGVPVSQEDHTKWLEEFERIVTPDKTTGERGLDNILSNDVLLYKTYVIMAKFGEDKVIEMMTKGRESAKEEVFKRLGITPNFSGGNAREYTGGKDVDYAEAAKLLSIPQR